MLIYAYDGGNSAYTECNIGEFSPSRWTTACSKMFVGSAPVAIKVTNAIDLSGDKMRLLMKHINDPSGLLPAGTELAPIFFANGVILRDLVVRNCVAVAGITVDVKVFGTAGNSGVNVAGETPDEVTDAAEDLSGSGYGGGITQIGATVTLSLAAVGYTRIPMGDVFLQDEGYVSITFNQPTGAGCLTVAALVDDMQLECACACPVAPCVTEYPDPACCV